MDRFRSPWRVQACAGTIMREPYDETAIETKVQEGERVDDF